MADWPRRALRKPVRYDDFDIDDDDVAAADDDFIQDDFVEQLQAPRRQQQGRASGQQKQQTTFAKRGRPRKRARADAEAAVGSTPASTADLAAAAAEELEELYCRDEARLDLDDDLGQGGKLPKDR